MIQANEVWFLFALFTWFIVHLDFLSRKEFLSTRHLRISLFRSLPFANCVGRSIANDHCRGVLEYDLMDRYSTLSENEASA